MNPSFCYNRFVDKKKFRKVLFSLILNISNFVIVAVCITLNVLSISDDFVAGLKTFKYFTNNSNIFSALASIGIIICDILILKKKREDIHMIALLFKEMAAVSVTVTLLVVMCFLGPVEGYTNFLLRDKGMCLHLVCPLMTILSYIFLEYSDEKKKNIFFYAIFATIPVAVYGTFYAIFVAITGVWEDFYGFNTNGMIALSYNIILAASYFLSLGLTFLHRLSEKKYTYIKKEENN